ncbi:MAG TPA: hypothetical protein VMU68_03760 [Acidimicrobiales bacterium]|nr:hypothetical protein [Acidimicrobiales bacterium]
MRWVVFGEVAFLFFMGVSVALHPGFVLARHEGGISEYGVHVKTAVLYTLAWVMLAGANMRAARACGGRGVRSENMRKLLLSYSVASSLVLISTYFYSLDAVLKYIHYGLGALLVVFMSAAAYWLFRQLADVPWARAALWVQLLGSTAALLSFAGVFHVLFCAESFSNVGCAILLAKTCSRSHDEGVDDIAVVAVAR